VREATVAESTEGDRVGSGQRRVISIDISLDIGDRLSSRVFV
jgi:hypothetical protein